MKFLITIRDMIWRYKEGKKRMGRGRQPKTAKLTENVIIKEVDKNQNTTN